MSRKQSFETNLVGRKARVQAFLSFRDDLPDPEEELKIVGALLAQADGERWPVLLVEREDGRLKELCPEHLKLEAEEEA